MKKNNVSIKLSIFTLGILLILNAVLIVKSDITAFTLVNSNKQDKFNINNSGYWELSNIIIDGDATGVGAHNWTWAENQPWCSGLGTFSSPYIIENVTIDGGGIASCIDIRDSDVYFEIHNCTFYNSGYGSPPDNDAGIRLYNVTHGRLFKNNCSNNGFSGIHIIRSYNNTILNNTLNDNFDQGLKLRLSYNNTVMNNKVNYNGFGIGLDRSYNNRVIENVVNDCSWYGIYVMEGHYNTLFKNKVTNCTASGIGMTQSNNTIISQNACEHNKVDGINIVLSYFTDIIENTLNYNTIYGISLSSGNNNTISANNITWNGQEGIYLESSNNSIIINNNLLDNVGCIQEVNCINNFFENNTCVIFDDVDPFLIINSPQDFDPFGDIAPTFNITIVEDNLNASWYILDDGITTVLYPFSSVIGMINQALWDAMQDGVVTITFYANDTYGNLGYISVDVIKDTAAPIITIISPSTDEVIGVNAPSYSISINEDNLDDIWYTLDGGLTNITITELMGPINQSRWDVMGDGLIDITFYANDTFGKIGFEIIPVYKDSIAPIITINSPSQNEIFGFDAPSYSISINEDNLDVIWYTLDGGINNITTTSLTGTIDQSIWESFGNGNVIIKFYARDLGGNIGVQEVSVTKEISSNQIGGFEISILIGIICMVSVIWVKKRSK